MSHNYSKHIIT